GLTVLGVVIGIASVTTMVSLGQGARERVQREFESLGSNVIIIFPERSQRDGARQGNVATLTAADADAIAEECPSVLAVSPMIATSGQVIGGNVNLQPAQMFGVSQDYPLVRNWSMLDGEFFTEREVAGAAKVCVLGHTLARRLFPEGDSIGRQVRVKNI